MLGYGVQLAVGCAAGVGGGFMGLIGSAIVLDKTESKTLSSEENAKAEAKGKKITAVTSLVANVAFACLASNTFSAGLLTGTLHIVFVPEHKKQVTRVFHDLFPKLKPKHM